MINLNDSAPPVTPDETRTFFALLNLVTDAKASAKRLQELFEAAEKAGEREHRAKIAESDLAVARDRHDEYLRASLAEHDAKMKSERVAHDHKCSTEMRDIRQAREEADRLLAQASADATAAAAMRADLEARHEKLKSAME